MFKPGDRVKIKKDICIYGSKIEKDVVYTVMSSYFGKTKNIIILENSYHNDDSNYVPIYVADHFEMDIKHSRKQKLNKICSKQVTK